MSRRGAAAHVIDLVQPLRPYAEVLAEVDVWFDVVGAALAAGYADGWDHDRFAAYVEDVTRERLQTMKGPRQ